VLPDVDEFGLIERLNRFRQSEALRKSLGVAVGIGDDAAVVEIKPGFQLVMSCDTMVQDVHFNSRSMSDADVGFKAMASALSDLAAMGAIPRFALVSLTAPPAADTASLERIYEGLYECADKYGVAIVGGDTTSTKQQEKIIAVTVIGEVELGKALLRSTAKAGDAVFITGYLGLSAAGLACLLSEKADDSVERANTDSPFELIKRHQRPLPQIQAGRTLLTSGCCHALNDISDGLANECWEIAKASDCGIVLFESQIPLADVLLRYAAQNVKDAMDWVLYGGEDYELIGTIPQAGVEQVRKDFASKQLAIHIIGEVAGYGAEVVMRKSDGSIVPISPKGYNHFAVEYYFQASCVQDTDRLAIKLASLLDQGTVIALDGDLGAGKTRFAQALAQALGVSEIVNSPTFTIIKEYQSGQFPLYHMDVYRIAPQEAENLGLDEYFYGDGITIVEWASRIAAILPLERLTIHIENLGDCKRNFRFIPSGEKYKHWCTELQKDDRIL